VINHSSTRFQTQDRAISLQTTLNLFLWWRDVLLSKAAGRLMSTNFSGTNFPRCEASGSSVECQMASPQQRDPHLVSDRSNKLPVTSHSLNFNWIHVYIGTSSILWTMNYGPIKKSPGNSDSSCKKERPNSFSAGCINTETVCDHTGLLLDTGLFFSL